MKYILDLKEINVIKLYELKYINQQEFFDLITGCGEQTEAEEGIDRFLIIKTILNISSFRISFLKASFVILPFKQVKLI